MELGSQQGITLAFGDEPLDLARVEAGQRDDARDAATAPLGQGLGEGRVRVSAARGRDDDHRFDRVAVEHVAEQMYRRRRRPVRIVDDEHERRVARRDREGARQRSEQDVARGVGIRCSRLGERGYAQLQIGKEGGERPGSAADILQHRLGIVAEKAVEHLRKRLIRQQRLLVAAAGQNDCVALAGRRHDFADQPRLADAGFAVDDDETPPESDAFDRVLQHCELTAAPHERAALRRHPRGQRDGSGAGFADGRRGRGRREVEVGILAQDRTLEPRAAAARDRCRAPR